MILTKFFLKIKKKKTIYIPIEIKYREYNSQLLLAKQAAQNGYRVYIGPDFRLLKIMRLKPQKAGIYHYKSVTRLNELKDKLDVFTRIDQEIGPAIDDYDFITRISLKSDNHRFLNRYYTVGNLATIAARQHMRFDDVEIVETGWPRMDLWKKDFFKLYENDVETIKRRYGDFILFSSDFGLVDRDRIKGLELQLKDVGVEGDDWQVIEKNASSAHLDFLKFLEILSEIDSYHDLPHIIIRPHPSENKEIWVSEIKKFKNINVVYDGEITPWILASQGLLHRGCTSGLQAFLMDKPSGFILEGASLIRESVSFLCSTKLSNTQEIINWLKDSYSTGKQLQYNDNPKNLVSKRIKFDNKLAVDRIIDDFNTFQVSKESELDSLSGFKRNEIIRKLKRWVKRNTGIGKNIRVYEVNNKMRYHIPSDKIPNGLKAYEANDTLQLLGAQTHIRAFETGIKDVIRIESIK